MRGSRMAVFGCVATDSGRSNSLTGSLKVNGLVGGNKGRTGQNGWEAKFTSAGVQLADLKLL